MTKQTQEQGRERLYTELVAGAQDLTRRVSTQRNLEHFDDFVEEVRVLREKLILGYGTMPNEDYMQAGGLIDHVKQYLHETLDVQRVRSMRGVITRNVRRSRG